MTAAEFAKCLARRPYATEAGEFTHGSSLNAIARKHAAQNVTMRAGTAFDWEDLERYQEELARLDREGPGEPRAKERRAKETHTLTKTLGRTESTYVKI